MDEDDEYLYDDDFKDDYDPSGSTEEKGSRSSPKKQQNSKSDDMEDEQKTQKVNAQMEALQEEINKLQNQLQVEKQAHRQSKLEIDHQRKELEELKATKEKSTGPNKIYEALYQHAMAHSIDVSVFDSQEMDEQAALKIIKETGKALDIVAKKPLKKQASLSSMTGGGGDANYQQKIANLEEELRAALGAAEDIRALKAKAIHLVERIRTEKEERLKTENELKTYNKKMEMLTDHIEKLMIHLKHEAASKIKALDQFRESEKRAASIQSKLVVLTRKVAAKDTLICELREGSKILEDQLRLMDEKYLELRTKLDYAREMASKKVKIAQKTANDLRMKYALAGNKQLLDYAPLPSINYQNESFDMSLSKSTSNINSKSMHSPPSGNNKRNQGGRNGSSLSKHNSSVGDNEQATEHVLEKIRRLRGQKAEWTEEKMRNLVNTR